MVWRRETSPGGDNEITTESSAEDIAAAVAAQDQSQATPSYIGVGNEWTPRAYSFSPGSGQGRAADQGFVSGDEYAFGSDPINARDWQFALVSAGLVDLESVRPGVWGNADASAMRIVMGIANRTRSTLQEALQVLAENPSIGERLARSRGSGSGPSRVVQLANPNDLAAVANEVAPSVIGRRLNDDEMRRFIAAYHSTERGGTAGNAQVAAQTFAEETDPTQASVVDLADVYEQFLGIIGAGRGGG